VSALVHILWRRPLTPQRLEGHPSIASSLWLLKSVQEALDQLPACRLMPGMDKAEARKAAAQLVKRRQMVAMDPFYMYALLQR